MQFPASTPLGLIKTWLRARVNEGVTCPACEQRVQVYRRKITATSAAALIRIWRAGGTTDFVHIPTVLGRKQADEGKLRYWGLMEEETTRRPDGGRAGYWRVTDLGEAWIKGDVRVAKYARVYDSRCLGLDTSKLVTIQDALTTEFNYSDLMAGV